VRPPGGISNLWGWIEKALSAARNVHPAAGARDGASAPQPLFYHPIIDKVLKTYQICASTPEAQAYGAIDRPTVAAAANRKNQMAWQVEYIAEQGIVRVIYADRLPTRRLEDLWVSNRCEA
jgi:hypothetical protein